MICKVLKDPCANSEPLRALGVALASQHRRTPSTHENLVIVEAGLDPSVSLTCMEHFEYLGSLSRLFDNIST